jgi:hypothetical protein
VLPRSSEEWTGLAEKRKQERDDANRKDTYSDKRSLEYPHKIASLLEIWKRGLLIPSSTPRL